MKLRNGFQLSNMKTRTLIGTLAIFVLLTLGARAQVTVTTVSASGMSEPYSCVVDANDNLYVADSAHNRILRIDGSTQAQTTLAGIPSDPPGNNDGPSFLAHLNNPQGLLLVTLGGVDGLLVSDTGNSTIRFVRLSDGYVTTLAGQAEVVGPASNATGANATFAYPAGLDKDANGNIYIADWGNNTIRVMNLNDPSFGITNLVIAGTTFYRPTAMAFAGTNRLWIADTGNQLVKLVTLTSPTSGNLTTYLGGYRTTGTADSPYGASARFNGPSGLLWLEGVGVLISDTANNTVRLATNNPSLGATNYAVVTFAGTAGQSGLSDGSALSAKFNSPFGLAQDTSNNGFLVADSKNNAIRRIQTGPAQSAVPAPAIGWVDFTVPPAVVVSILRTAQPFVFNNDVVIAIDGTDGTETMFTYGPTPANPLQDTIPNPSLTSGSTPPPYHDGMYPEQVPASIIAPQADVTIKAIGVQSGRPNSAIVSARFQFKTANPAISGNNAAWFTISDLTTNATMYYTVDGSDPSPTNATSIGPLTVPPGSVKNMSLNATANITLKIRAYRTGYQPSDIVTTTFTPSSYIPNSLTFGFASGEASSDFVAAPGQFFYAPVTLNVVSGVKIYSLQFNMTVNSGGPNPGPAVAPGAFSFQSMLEKPLSDGPPKVFIPIPPLMFSAYLQNPPPSTALVTFGGMPFVNMMFTNNNLLGVGWLERFGNTNLFDTTKQDLITYSQAHDTQFSEGGGKIIVGGYAFRVPANAQPGQTYQIQLGLPSATSDGIGMPGSEVVIAMPVTGFPSSSQVVTAGQRKYVAGDCAPFRWFNAGDFGNTNLDNADLEQVFQSAIYLLNYPPAGSDFFDSMDSCGYYGADLGHGYLEKDTVTPVDLNALFTGTDTTINQMAFGDGQLDVCDIYVTFRRSLDTNLLCFRRFWTNGVLGAEAVGNPPPKANVRIQNRVAQRAVNAPAVNFAAGDAIGTAGQTLQIPITAQIIGDYPLRVLMLNLTVDPLDGSPALTSAVQFTPNPALGAVSLATSSGLNNYAAAWLNSSIAGLTGTATLGTLSVTIPANATSSAAYAIHFEHASASPNGLASFPKQALTGLITLSSRSASFYNDGIPDSWRLRYFGSVYNVLSQAAADADGDGGNNWQEYQAGTDPMNAQSVLRVSNNQAAALQGQDCVIHWPSVVGKNYIIERATSLFGTTWSPVSTNAGTGSDMEVHDSSGGNARFYRVRLAP